MKKISRPLYPDVIVHDNLKPGDSVQVVLVFDRISYKYQGYIYGTEGSKYLVEVVRVRQEYKYLPRVIKLRVEPECVIPLPESEFTEPVKQAFAEKRRQEAIDAGLIEKTPPTMEELRRKAEKQAGFQSPKKEDKPPEELMTGLGL